MHMSPLDKVRQLRFEGYTVGMLAIEIDLLREGRGTGTMSNAVDALARIATTLHNIDDTLRTELSKLGVEWRGEASTVGNDAMMTSADFADDATDKINETAQVAFGLSEAFQRALHALPESRTLREGAGGLRAMDVLADLIGHETDHAATVRDASAARDQAVDALNLLASTCADELASIRQLSEPGAIVLHHGQQPPAQPGSGAAAGYQAMAAAAESVSGPDGRPGGLPTAPMNAGTPPEAAARVMTAAAVTDEDGTAGAATAIGAAAIAGATSAERDRERRSNPYVVADNTDETSRHELDIGVIEDEAAADVVAEIAPNAGQDTPAYLEHAAPQRPIDAGVRTRGIDDADLFADDRLVARDTIDEDPSTAYYDDKPDSP